MGQMLSMGSMITAFLVSMISIYLQNINKISFENLMWIVIGSMAILMIMQHQETRKELEDQRRKKKRIGEKFKIHDRLNKIEERLKNG